MKRERIYHILNTSQDGAQQRHELSHFLREQLAQRVADPNREREVAYDMAGLLSTQFAAALPDDDPYKEIMLIAGELELPPEHRGDATWEQLAERIAGLRETDPS